jgi:hypothetical protein
MVTSGEGTMHARKWLLVLINLVGGAAVLGSYAYGLLAHPGASGILWGGVPSNVRSFYTAGMVFAATGYFAFTGYILLRLDPRDTRVGRRFGFSVFNGLYAAILFPSALWMPVTLLTIAQSSTVLLWTVRVVLAAVGLASLGLLLSLLSTEPRQPPWAYWVAVVGCVGFCIQTVILDAIIWVAWFHL